MHESVMDQLRKPIVKAIKVDISSDEFMKTLKMNDSANQNQYSSRQLIHKSDPELRPIKLVHQSPSELHLGSNTSTLMYNQPSAQRLETALIQKSDPGLTPI